MKKLVFAAAAALLMFVSVDSFAQLSVGMGYTGSKLKSKVDMGGSKTKSHFNANGVYFEGNYNFAINENWGIEPGLQWVYVSDKNFSIADFKIQDKENAEKFRENYLNIPVNVTYGIQFESIRAFAFAGPEFSFDLTSKLKYTQLDGSGHTTDSENVLGSYSKFDVLFGFGVGVDFFDKVRVKFGYNLGMVNRGSSDHKYHRNQVQVGVAYIF